ncbi:hypothetical protein Ccrd_016075 [Cynara cardunculus var. scolymus]|uniref:Uncharacterized protein n=1 Tax=Cynara cardunculus var. scolymus TaxID=59895 RepID=A0A103YAL4_CYNCS|nr:hypothetical protein Ccrd_016075 [Cynara cardunculus var. scolymus]
MTYLEEAGRRKKKEEAGSEGRSRKKEEAGSEGRSRKRRKNQEKERDSSDQLHNYVQKQRDEEFCRKIMELKAELASSNELRQKLDCKESVCEMKRSIESRDRKITMLSEKINADILSFDTIQKEASFVKQVVDNAQSVVNEKEEVGMSSLNNFVFQLYAYFESLLIPLAILSGSIKNRNGQEKINDLETELESNEIELKRKGRVITEFPIQLETTKITDQCQSKIEEISIPSLL